MFNNTGTVRMTGTGTSGFGTGLTITSTDASFETFNDVIEIASDTTFSGLTRVTGDDALDLTAGTHTLADGATLAGNLRLGGATVQQSLSTDTATLSGNIDYASGSLDVPGTLTVEGFFDWNGVTEIDGQGTGVLELPAGTGVLVTSSAPTLRDITVNNRGDFDFGSANGDVLTLILTDFNNLSDANFRFSTDGIFVDSTATFSSFDNTGTIEFTGVGANSGFSGPGLTFTNNNGIFEASDDSIEIASDASWSGRATISGEPLSLSGGTQTLANGVEFVGDVNLTGATVQQSLSTHDALFAGTLEYLSGAVIIPGTVTIEGTFNWSSPTTINATNGVIEIPAGSTMNLTGGTKALSSFGGGINNSGQVFLGLTPGSNLQLTSGATFNNLPGALFEFQDQDNIVLSSGTFANQGEVRMSGSGPAASGFGAGITVTNTADSLIDVQSGGILRVTQNFANDGDINVANGAEFETLGTFTSSATSSIGGDGTITVAAGAGTLVMAGQLEPSASPGTLTIDGNLDLDGILGIEVSGLAAGTEHDQLVVTGDADVTGATLRVNEVDGFGFGVGDTIAVMTFGSNVGATGFGAVIESFGDDFNVTVDTGGAPGTADVDITANDSYVFFDGDAADGLWQSASNWSGDALPGAADDVLIPGGIGTVTLSSGARSVNRIEAKDALVISGGSTSLDIANESNLHRDFTLSSATLQGPGNVEVHGDFNFPAGTITGSGDFITRGESTLSGAGSMTLTGRVWENEGVIRWTGNDINLSDAGAVLSNEFGGVLSIETGLTGRDIIGAGRIENQGVIRKTGGAAFTEIQVALENAGTLLSVSGDLELQASLTNFGNLIAGTGASIVLESTTDPTVHTLLNGTDISGGGTFHVAGNGTELSVAAPVTIDGASTLLLGTGAPLIDISGSGSLIVDGDFVFEAGTVRGPGDLTTNGETTIVVTFNDDSVVEGLTWENFGEVVLAGTSGEDLVLNDVHAVLDNQGLISIDTTSNSSDISGAGRIVNHGLLRKTGSASETQILTSVYNDGTVLSTSGDLQFEGSLDSEGGIVTAAGATVTIDGGTSTFTGGVSVSGAGGLQITGNTTELRIAAPTTIGDDVTLTLGGLGDTPAIALVDDLRVDGEFVFNTGTVRGPADLETYGLTTIVVTFNDDSIVDEGVFWSNFGTLVMSGGSGENLVLNDVNTRLVNQGVISIETSSTSSDISGAGHIQNDGILQKTGAATATEIFTSLSSSGTVLSTSGDLQLKGTLETDGELRTGAGATITLNGGTSSLTGGASVSGAGTLQVSGNGTELAIEDPVTIEAGTTLSLGGTGGFPTLALSDDLTIDGTFAFNAGTVAGDATLTTFGATNVTFAFNDDSTVDDIVWDNFGALTMTGASGDDLVLTADAQFNNQAGATFTIATSSTSADISGAGTLINFGLLEKTGAASSTEIFPSLVNFGDVAVTNGALIFRDVYFQGDGTTDVASGATLQVDVGLLEIAAGVLSGGGSITGSVHNAEGTVAAGNSIGSLSISGDYRQSALGTLAIEIDQDGTPGTDFDQLSVGGNLSLAGNLDIVVNDPLGTPVTSGETFEIIDYAGTLSGDFADVSPSFGATYLTDVDGFGGGGDYEIQVDSDTNYFDFTGNGDGTSWLDPANWLSPAGAALIPGNLDDARVAIAVTVSVDVPENVRQLATVAGSTIAVGSGGTLTLEDTSRLGGDLSLSNGGILDIAEKATVVGTFTFGNATVSGADGTLNTAGATTLGTGGSDLMLLDDATWNNTGTATWADGDFQFGDEASDVTTFNNLVGGVFNINNPGNTLDIQVFAGAIATINNEGAVVVNSPGPDSDIFPQFNNLAGGTVTVNSGGVLKLNDDGVHAGTFTIGASGELSFESGFHSLGPTSDVTGAGLATTSGATVFIGGSYDVDTQIDAGSLEFETGSTVTLPALTLLGGQLDGPDDVSVVGAFLWQAGTIDGFGNTLTTNGTSTLNTSSTKTLSGRTLENAGTMTWTDGDVDIQADGTLTNLLAGTFNVQNVGNTLDITGGGVFNNLGNLIVNAVPLDSDIFPTFNNDGTVTVTTGTLQLRGGGVHNGTFAVADTLDFAGGDHALDGSAQITGAGTVAVTGGGQLDVIGSTVDLSADLTIDSARTVGGGGQLVVNSGSTLTFDNAFLAFDLVNDGNVIFTGASDGIFNGILAGASLTGVGDVTFSGGTTDIDQTATYALNGNTAITGTIVNFENDATTEGFIHSGGTLGGGGSLNAGLSWTPSTGAVVDGLLALGGSVNETLGGGQDVAGTGTIVNDGSLTLQGVTINPLLEGGGTVLVNSGTNTVDTFDLDASSSLTVQSGATLSVTNPSDVGSLTLGVGTLTGAGDVTVHDLLAWNAAGLMLAGGTTIVAQQGSMDISSASIKELRRVLQHDSITGASVWQNNGRFDFLNGTLNNTGHLDITASAQMFDDGGTNLFDNSGTLTVNSTGTAQVEIPFNNSGLVRIESNTLTLEAGSTSPGDFRVAGTLDVLGGTHDLTDVDVRGSGTVDFSAGTTTIADGGGGATYSVANTSFSGGVADINIDADTDVLTLSTGDLGNSAGTPTFTVNNQFDWISTGLMTGTGTTLVDTGATMTIGPGSTKGLRRVLQHDSTTGFSAWTTAGINFLDGTLNNTGILDITVSNQMALQGGTNVFNNSGTLTVNSSGTAQIEIPFNNTGTVDAQLGTINFELGGLSPGDFTVSGAGAAIDFSGIHDLTDADFTGPGTIRFSGGTATIDDSGGPPATYSVGTTELTGGIVDINFDADTDVLTLSTGDLGNSAGTPTFTVNNQFDWTSTGFMTGTGTTVVDTGATMTIGPGSTKGLRRVLQHDSTTGLSAWTTGGIDFLDGTLNNTGILDITVSNQMALQGGTNVFNNSGTLTVNSSGTAQIEIPFNNTGTVDAQLGTINFELGGLSPGDFTVSGAGAAIDFSGIHDLTDADFTGPGTIRFSGGTSTIDDSGGPPATYSVGTTELTGGTVDINFDADTDVLTLSTGDLGNSAGTPTFTVNNQFDWTNPSFMTGTGTTVVDTGATMTIGPGSTKQLRRVLQHDSTTGFSAWSTGQIDFLDGTLNNTGILDITVSNQMALQGGTNVFNNSGTLTGNSSGTAQIEIPFNNTGIVDVQSGILQFEVTYDQTAGTTLLSGGTLAGLGTSLDFDGGTLEGGGTISGTVNMNAGSTLSAGTSLDTLNVTDIVFGNGSFFDVELGAALASDVVAASTNVTINAGATINVLEFGGYTGVAGDMFSVLTAGGTFTGTFDTVNQPANFDVTTQYLGSSLRLDIGTLNNFWLDGNADWRDSTANWSQGIFPIADHKVIFGSGVNVTHTTADAEAIGELVLDALSSLSFSNGSLDIAIDSNIEGALTVTGASTTLQGAGNISLDGIFNLGGGATVSGNGANTLTTNGITGNVTLTGGVLTNRAWDNHALLNWDSGDLTLTDAAAVFTNKFVGTVNANSASASDDINGLGSVVNDGQFTKIANSNTQINVGLANSATGQVNVSLGTLQLRADSTSAGEFDIATLTTLSVDNDIQLDLNVGATVSGDGTFEIHPGDTLAVNTAVAFDPNLTLDLDAGTIASAQNLTIPDDFQWTNNGLVTGAGAFITPASSTTTVTGGAVLTGLAWDSFGSVDWDSGDVTLTDAPAVLTVEAGTGVFNSNSASAADDINGLGSVLNDGLFTNNANTTTPINVALTNSTTGQMNLTLGRLQLRAASTNAGDIDIAALAILSVDNDIQLDLNVGATVSGDGTFEIHPGDTLAVNTAVAFDPNLTLDLDAGTIASAQNLTIPDDFQWTNNGLVTGAGAFITPASSTTTVTGGAVLTGLAWDSFGSVDWDSGDVTLTDAPAVLTVEAGTGVFNSNSASAADDINGLGSVLNDGLFTNNANTTTPINAGFANTGSVDLTLGTLAFNTSFTQTGAGAVTRLNGGNLSATVPLDFDGGRLEGSGTVFGTLNMNAGSTLIPGTSLDTLNVTDIVFGIGSFFDVELGAGMTSDVVAASNNVTINSGATMNVLQDAGYTGSAGDMFAVLTAGGTFTGTFDTVVQPTDFVADPIYTPVAGGNLTLAVTGVFNRWINGSADWRASTTNWSRSVFPDSTHIVVIDTGGITVTHNTADMEIIVGLELDATSTFDLNGGSLDVTGDSTLDGSLELTGGTLTGLGNITVTGLTTWNTAGNFSTTTIDGPGATLFAQGGFAIGASVDDATLVLNRTLDIGVGSNANWLLNINDGPYFINGSGDIVNRGSVDAKNTDVLNVDVPFTNDTTGIVTKSAGNGNLRFNFTFDNAGLVDANFNIIELDGGGTHTGTFNIAANLDLEGGPHTFNAGSVNGTGTLQNTGASSTFNAGYNLDTNLNVSTSAGTFTLNTGSPVTLNSQHVRWNGDREWRWSYRR